MKRIMFLLPLLFSAKLALACDLSIQATNAWARPTIGNDKQTAIYFDLKNMGDEAITLVDVSSPSGDASMHESMEHDGMMHMQPLGKQEIKPGKTLSFAPGHNHIMLEQLKEPLKVGDKIKLTLYFADESSTTFTVPVSNKAVSGMAKQHHQHHAN